MTEVICQTQVKDCGIWEIDRVIAGGSCLGTVAGKWASCQDHDPDDHIVNHIVNHIVRGTGFVYPLMSLRSKNGLCSMQIECSGLTLHIDLPQYYLGTFEL